MGKPKKKKTDKIKKFIYSINALDPISFIELLKKHGLKNS